MVDEWAAKWPWRDTRGRCRGSVRQTCKSECRHGLFLRPNRLRFPPGELAGFSWTRCVALAVATLKFSDLDSLQVLTKSHANQCRAVDLGSACREVRGAQQLGIQDGPGSFPYADPTPHHPPIQPFMVSLVHIAVFDTGARRHNRVPARRRLSECGLAQ